MTLLRNMRGEPRHLQWRSEIRGRPAAGTANHHYRTHADGGRTDESTARLGDERGEISKEVRAQAEAGYDLVKVHSGLSAGLLGLVGAVADSTHQALVGHLMDGGLSAALDAHQASIEHVDADVWTEASIDGDMAKLAQAGAYLCPTFTTFYDGNPDTTGGGDLPRPSARHRAMVSGCPAAWSEAPRGH